ncbi:cell division protein ZapE [Pseudoalteromonas sp. ZZD1]|uniref:cell division protein ZapE n=1 Tax=Pseudoalteromonas sp. ZZD1 TaxID=3139395 RepID=UPI003BAD2BC7
MTDKSGQILQHYEQLVASKQLSVDVAQQRAIVALDRLFLRLQTPTPWWRKQPNICGVYLYGPVGRGKSMMMDLFYRQLNDDKKVRLHFHHFMAQIHQRLGQLQGSKNPLEIIAKEWRSNVNVLCFDEFFVSDIGDAMLMAGLFKALFKQGLILIATSNCHPDELYRNGLQRARFLPTINLLKEHCKVISVEGECDHRFRFGHQFKYYFINDDVALTTFFEQREIKLNSHSNLNVCHRPIHFIHLAKEAILFDFMALCSGPRSTTDYIFLAEHFERVYIANVPVMGSRATGKQIVHGIEDSYQREKQNLQEHTLDDEARRFIALVDEFYDRGKLLVISTQADMANLYCGKKLAFEYARTESRLVEMQSW